MTMIGEILSHPEKLRVLVVSAVCTLPSYRSRFQILAREHPDIEVTLYVPSRWRENDVHHRLRVQPEERSLPNYQVLAGRILSNGYPNRVLFGAGLSTALHTVKPHVIHLEFEPWSLVHWQVRALLGDLRGKVRLVFRTSVGRVHYRTKSDAVSKSIYRRVMATYHGAVCLNESAKAALSRNGGYSGLAIVLPQEIDTDLFRPAPERERCRVRQRIGVDHEFCVGYVGRLAPGKGVELLLRAFARVKVPAKLVIVGGGPLRRPLEELARTLHVSDRTVWIAPCPREQVPNYLAAMDVLVLPSEGQEFFGRSIAEAMACEIPVIGSSCGSIPRVVGKCGLIFEERNLDQLHQRLEQAAVSPDQMKTMARLGRRRVVESFSVSVVAARLGRFYWDVMGSGKVAATRPKEAVE